MSTQITFILYLLYGFVFILMGVIIFQQRNKDLSGFPILRTLPSLGLFGIFHGISEWLTMAQIAGLYHEYSGIILAVKGLLKVLSFYFLFRFALMTLPRNNGSTASRYIRRIADQIPLLLLLAWLLRFGILYGVSGIDYLAENRMWDVIINRYLMSFPAGVIAFIGLFLSGRKIQRMHYQDLHRWYYGLAITVLSYGIFDGLLVRKMDFFPANILNNQLFLEVTGVPVQGVKIILGILMTYFVVQISRVFEGEKRALIDQMLKDRAVEVEREKMNREIHDRIIQKMYGAGLKIEAYFGKENKAYLQEANQDLQQGIREARSIISKTIIEDYHSKDLESVIKDFIRWKEKEVDFEIIFDQQVPTLYKSKDSKEKVTQIYYILHEAVTNAAKHSGASKLWIRLKGEYDRLTMEIQDNGSGFKPEIENSEEFIERKTEGSDGIKMGLEIMKDRAEEIGGTLAINSDKNGTTICLDVQWGGDQDEEE